MEPPAGEDVHAYPPEETRKHAQRSGNLQVIGGGGVARMKDPRVHQHWNVDA